MHAHSYFLSLFGIVLHDQSVVPFKQFIDVMFQILFVCFLILTFNTLIIFESKGTKCNWFLRSTSVENYGSDMFLSQCQCVSSSCCQLRFA